MKTVNYICSLGTLCHTASWLKQFKIKKCSFPFDWIFSDPVMVNDCIKNNFVKFLDRNLHIKNTKKLNKSGHKIYGSNIFNHHNILEDEHFKYYVRCVKRFSDLLIKKENKLFILLFTNKNHEITKKFKRRINNLYKTLQENTNNFNLLIVWHMIGTELKSNVIKNCNFGNLKYIYITTINKSNGLHIKNKKEDKYFNKCIYDLYNYQIINNIK